MAPWKRRLLILLVLLVAAALRLLLLDSAPPGLTHDEANHGREALGVLAGVRPYYFPYNYGSEPLYSYAVAGVLGLVGGHIFGLRLLNALLGVAAVAATYAWGRRALRRRHAPQEADLIALAGAAFMAVSFWPVAAAREALRAGMLPLITVLAAQALWLLPDPRRRLWGMVGLALAIAAALHNYLAARVWWAIFPAFVLYALLPAAGARRWRRALPALLGALGGAALLVTPMFVYLRRNPDIQPRLRMLDSTLDQLIAGQLGPLLTTAWDAVLGLFVPGFGDGFLAYNIPGRPLFDPLTGILFLLGLLLALRRWREPGYAFLLLWLGAGLLPSLATGATANTTRNAAAMPALYLLLGLGLSAPLRWLAVRRPARYRPVAGLAAAWIAVVGLWAGVDYFVRWNNDPDVRAAYHHNFIAAVETLDPAAPAVVSSPLPGVAHDISLAIAATGVVDPPWRGVDLRQALIVPAGGAPALVAGTTPPHPALAPLLSAGTPLGLPADGQNPDFSRYTLTAPPPAGPPLANFDDALLLEEARWLAESVSPGGMAELLTVWRVVDPDRVGPPALPAGRSDVMFFTHVLRPDGTILAQQDALHAPSWSWQPGDRLLQIHQIWLDPALEAGAYAAQVGVYDRATQVRLPLSVDAPSSADNVFAVAPLIIAP